MNKLAKFLDDLDAKGPNHIPVLIIGVIGCIFIFSVVFAIVMS